MLKKLKINRTFNAISLLVVIYGFIMSGTALATSIKLTLEKKIDWCDLILIVHINSLTLEYNNDMPWNFAADCTVKENLKGPGDMTKIQLRFVINYPSGMSKQQANKLKLKYDGKDFVVFAFTNPVLKGPYWIYNGEMGLREVGAQYIDYVATESSNHLAAATFTHDEYLARIKKHIER